MVSDFLDRPTTQVKYYRWSIVSGKALRYVYPPTSEAIYDMLWDSLYGKDELIFSVKACEDVRLLLSDVIGTATSNAIELVLGTMTNTRFEIKNYRSGSVYVYEDHSGLLNCNAFVSFWVSWHGGLLKLGSGALPGQQVIIYDQIEDVINFAGVSFAAVNTQMTQFEFSVNKGECRAVLYYRHLYTVSAAFN